MNQVEQKETSKEKTISTGNFFTVQKFANKNKSQGCWPDTDAAIWALRAGSPENGFGKAFVTIGRRVLIDEIKFCEAIANLQEAKNASSK